LPPLNLTPNPFGRIVILAFFAASDLSRRLPLMEERITLAERNHQSLSSRYNRLRDRVEELRVSLMRTTGEFPAHDDPSSESPDESET
jgi:hypothetical protein